MAPTKIPNPDRQFNRSRLHTQHDNPAVHKNDLDVTPLAPAPRGTGTIPLLLG